jgi:hypothetical protein
VEEEVAVEDLESHHLTHGLEQAAVAAQGIQVVPLNLSQQIPASA